MRSNWRDWRVVGGLASMLMFGVVFTWLSLFVGAGYDGDSPTPVVARFMIAFGLAAPVFVLFVLANMSRRHGPARGAHGFEVAPPDDRN